MGESPDQIRGQIAERRTAASDKIDRLQSQVQDTADQMRTQVQDTADHLADQAMGTVDQVKDQAKTAVEETVQTIKENVDLRQQIEERPMVALGAALFGGFLLGHLLSDDGSHGHQSYTTTQPGGTASGMGNTLRESIRTAAGKSGLEEMITNSGTALLGSVTDQLKEVLDRNFPGFTDKLQSHQTPPDHHPTQGGGSSRI
jgi:ElaB/YqjD/DUF883 family membrane-anchored ribosome-binding protein